MKNFELKGIELNVSRETAFAFIADAEKLPQWTNAFASVTAGRAVMRTPDGEVSIDLAVEASPGHGTVDWRMTFADGSVATAFSRVVEIDRDRCVFGIVLTPPPLALEQIEGTLESQSQALEKELRKLKKSLESHG
ncbi:MAG: SRPBCC family protein [Acidobacteriota bacterium]